MHATATSIDPNPKTPLPNSGLANAGQNTSSKTQQIVTPVSNNNNTISQGSNAASINTTSSNIQNQALATQNSNTQTTNTSDSHPEAETTTTSASPDDPQSTAGMMDWLSHNKKTVVKFANYTQSILNGFSFITKFPLLSPLKKIGDQLGELGTKFFFLVNGAINAFQQFQFKNITGFLGYMVYVFNGLFVEQKNTYMMNGLGVGLTQLSNQVNNVTGKGNFKTVTEHFTNLANGTAKIFKESWKNPFKAAMAGKPILGATGALMSLAGFLYWAITGDMKGGSLVRDFGGGVIDGEQILPHQYHFKRKNYIRSGWTYLVGTAFDLLSKFIPSKSDYFRPLCFLFDGFGRYFQGVSEQNKEQSNEHLAPAKRTELERSFHAKQGSKNANIVANAPHQGELASAAA